MNDLDRFWPAIASGDAEVFGQWMAAAERPLRLSLRPFAARVDTEAVVQETLLRVWQVAPGLQADGRPNVLVRVALRIARNLAISELRRTRQAPVEVSELDAQGALATSDVTTDPLLRKTLAECREALPDKPAQALDARLAARGAEADEVIAEGLGMKLNTFLQNFTRARKFLAECLRARGIELDGAWS